MPVIKVGRFAGRASSRRACSGGIPQQREHAVTDQVGGGLVAGDEQQDAEADDLRGGELGGVAVVAHPYWDVQDPAQVRDLGVGFGSLRTVRAEAAVDVR